MADRVIRDKCLCNDVRHPFNEHKGLTKEEFSFLLSEAAAVIVLRQPRATAHHDVSHLNLDLGFLSLNKGRGWKPDPA